MELVTLDLDGTLLRTTVFRVVGEELGHGEKIRFVDDLYERGVISLRAAWYAEYPLFLGVPVQRAHEALATGDWLADIEATVDELGARGVDVWVLTDQPDWATSFLSRFGIEEGVFTRTTRWQGDAIGAAVDVAFDKRPALLEHLRGAGIAPEDVVHVGNGANDVPVFEAVGAGIAFNPSGPSVRRAGDATVRSDSLAAILEEL